MWSYGEAVTPVLERYLFAGEALRPYVRDVMRDAHENGQPVLRGLFHEFPDDARCWTVKDQYLLGPDLLVAPVMTTGARSRRVVLPTGAKRTDTWSGEVFPGGGEAEVDAPLDRIPVFVRDGAVPGVVAALRAALGAR